MGMVSRPLEQERRYIAVCSSTDVEGDLVQVLGEPTIGVFQVQKIDVGAHATMPASAIIVEKTTATACVIQFPGQIKNVYVGLTPGLTYFADDSGRPSLTPPGPSISMPRVYVQPVGVALSEDILLFHPSRSLIVRNL